MRPGKREPAGGHLRASDAIGSMRALYGKGEVTRSRRGWQSPRLPANWRQRLPDPAAYYAQHVARLGKANATGWAQGACPFHDDRNASLSVHVAEGGGWRCFAGCGGGDLLGFHMRRTGLGFVEAVRDLVGVRA